MTEFSTRSVLVKIHFLKEITLNGRFVNSFPIRTNEKAKKILSQITCFAFPYTKHKLYANKFKKPLLQLLIHTSNKSKS